MIKFNTIESNIIEALGGDILTFEQLATKTGYEVSGHFRRTVLSLCKRGILGNKRLGYFVQPQYRQLVSKFAE